MRTLLAVPMLLAFAAASHACCIMIPKEPDLPPLVLKKHKVQVTIDNLVAVTKVDQVFANNTSRQLEATYVFPLPAGASVTEFALWIDGKRQKAEMLEKEKARSIYEEIVRQRKDPGLLEYVGENLFQARVFPIPPNGDQRVEIVIQQPLAMDAGLAEYRYPLKGLRESPPQELTIDVSISSQIPIKSVYSPSLAVAVHKTDDRTAKASFEDARAVPENDFSLFITSSEKEFGLNLLASRKPGEDGYFMLMLAPKQELDKNAIVTRDVCFVFDCSGSMRGEKMEQAKAALKYCVQALNPGDRFNVLRFSTDVDGFAPSLLDAKPEEIRRAVAWIEKLEAVGGTAIDEALGAGFKQLDGSTRPAVLVFLTDGKPTVGATDAQVIAQRAAKSNTRSARLFALGVGVDLNAKLLDQLAEDGRGVPVYVAPQEDIEVKVSGFYSKISQPVLTDLALDFGKIATSQVYPSKLPDLYQGSQLVLYGRYKDGGDTAIKLSGTRNGQKVEFAYDAKFPAEELERDFIPRLWATRRVGYLLDEIRRNGEQAELKDEVIQLARKYGIVTPYTSYLVVDEREQLAAQPEPPMDGAMHRQKRDGVFPVAAKPALEESRRSSEFAGGGAAAPSAPAPAQAWSPADKDAAGAPGMNLADYIGAESGARAVEASKAVQELKSADAPGKAERSRAAEREVEGRTFTLSDGVWTDTAYKTGMPELKIKYGSQAYFDIAFGRADLKKALALGEKVVIVANGKALIIGAEGKEVLAPGELDAFLK
ncbi:MAG: VWA domain-containing protein [Candidatus Wallbacteria bacterium]|nr:VWA domain-containing protein [Candidatus Wallbacteria bacterium]